MNNEECSKLRKIKYTQIYIYMKFYYITYKMISAKCTIFKFSFLARWFRSSVSCKKRRKIKYLVMYSGHMPQKKNMINAYILY